MSDEPSGYLCPKCKAELTRRLSQYHWRGRSFPGLVCVPCNALWDDPADSFWHFAVGTPSTTVLEKRTP